MYGAHKLWYASWACIIQAEHTSIAFCAVMDIDYFKSSTFTNRVPHLQVIRSSWRKGQCTELIMSMLMVMVALVLVPRYVAHFSFLPQISTHWKVIRPLNSGLRSRLSPMVSRLLICLHHGVVGWLCVPSFTVSDLISCTYVDICVYSTWCQSLSSLYVHLYVVRWIKE